MKKNTNKKGEFFKLTIIIIFSILYSFIFTNVINVSKFVNDINNYINNFFGSEGRIFICTLYNNEAEMAYIHIWRLYDYIDKFIIIISNMTYSGIPKKFSLQPFANQIFKYKNKIDIVFFNYICNRSEYPNIDKIWCFEMTQRDYAKTFIEKKYNPTEKDLLVIVDIDEIITREGIKYIKKHPPKEYYFLKGNIYFPYYYHRLEDWDWGLVVRYNKSMKTLSKFRFMQKTNKNTLKFENKPSKPFITHCTYCFKNIEEYKNKLKSFSHQNYNKPPFNTNNWIFKSHYCREKINSPLVEKDEPYEGWKHLIPNDKRLKYLVDRSFMYSIKQTTFTEKDLKTICNITYDRTLFEPSTKY